MARVEHRFECRVTKIAGPASAGFCSHQRSKHARPPSPFNTEVCRHGGSALSIQRPPIISHSRTWSHKVYLYCILPSVHESCDTSIGSRAGARPGKDVSMVGSDRLVRKIRPDRVQLSVRLIKATVSWYWFGGRGRDLVRSLDDILPVHGALKRVRCSYRQRKQGIRAIDQHSLYED